MFVCVRGDRIGHVLDRRNHADCPNFNNFCKKPAAELKVRWWLLGFFLWVGWLAGGYAWYGCRRQLTNPPNAPHIPHKSV